ncbi:hypothetical protein EMIT0111MI5_11395 [Burkholderia sp. IT-111MI5]
MVLATEEAAALAKHEWAVWVATVAVPPRLAVAGQLRSVEFKLRIDDSTEVQKPPNSPPGVCILLLKGPALVANEQMVGMGHRLRRPEILRQLGRP